eukprot:GHVP01067936.1.p1 GENE.GHVP01067936.1~~GHVP01067936.1.p1  ORF type:complete len:129 (-),score=4.98 GHVP01067936.1:443-829(-)
MEKISFQLTENALNLVYYFLRMQPLPFVPFSPDCTACRLCALEGAASLLFTKWLEIVAKAPREGVEMIPVPRADTFVRQIPHSSSSFCNQLTIRPRLNQYLLTSYKSSAPLLRSFFALQHRLKVQRVV